MNRFLVLLLVIMALPARADDMVTALNKRLEALTAADAGVSATGKINVTRDDKNGQVIISYPALAVRDGTGFIRFSPSRIVVRPDGAAHIQLPDTIMRPDGRQFRLSGQNITGTWDKNGLYVSALRGTIQNIKWSKADRGGSIRDVHLDVRTTIKSDMMADVAFDMAGGAVTTTSVMNNLPGAEGVLPRQMHLRGLVARVPRDVVMLGLLAPLAGRATITDISQDAGVEIVFDKISAETVSGIAVTGAGRLRPDPARSDRLIGKMDTRWRNLDRLGPGGRDSGVGFIAGLIGMLGVRDGHDTVLALEFMPGGGMRFNGRDLLSLLGGMGTDPSGAAVMPPFMPPVAPGFNGFTGQNPVDSDPQNP